MTVVALHGAAMAGARFGPNPDGWLWLDLPGHGTEPRCAPTVADMAEAVVQRLPGRCVLVGHSLGGMVAMHIAAHHPERVRALVLIDTPLWIPRWIMPKVARRMAPVVARMPGMVGRMMARRTTNHAARPTIRRAIGGTSAGGMRDAIVAACAFDARGFLPELRVPTLAFFGSHSRLTNKDMRDLMVRHPNTQTMTLSAGHMLQFDEVSTFAANVSAFVDRFDRGGDV